MIENIDFADPVIRIVSILLGIVVLIAGRKLFWLTVAAVGFVIGLLLAFTFLENQPAWVTVIVALVVGGVGAILAIFLQKVAVSIAGFLMGGYVAIWLLRLFEVNLNEWEILVFIIVGIIGAILVSYLFEFALIGLSALLGAAMIVQGTNFRPEIALILFIGLVIIGTIVQLRTQNRQSVVARD